MSRPATGTPSRPAGRSRGGPNQARGVTGPPPGAALVPRPRLGALLDGATTDGLTLLAAAPGSGKTVALREWAAVRTRADLAWVALTPRGDGDAGALWRRLAAALASGGRGAARGGETEVLRALDARRSPLLVVVDDAHEADDAVFAAFAERLIDHPSVRLIVSTRVDPRQPLHRLRVEGRLHEIRGDDLAFTADEARAMLVRQGVELTAEELALLVRRTEGWAAGLRLAALLLVDHERPGEAVREFAGDDRAVVAFLVHEVLDRQPPEVREMLVRTSVLRRVSGPLADALTEGFGGQAMLEDLVRRHALVEPLDRRGHWYRYHPLFADLLRSQLRRRGAGAIAEQDRRAARFLRDDEPAEALRHAARSGAWELVDALLRDHGLLLRAAAGAGGSAAEGGSAVDDALRDVPPAVLSRHPFMALFAAAQALGEGRDAAARALLAEAEAHAMAPAGERRGRLGVGLALVRALAALRAGDVAGVRHHAAVVLHGPATQDRTAVATRAVALLALGEALVADGDPDAERRLRDAAVEAGRARLPGLARRAEALRAWCYALDGHVRQAALAAADLSAGDRGAAAGSWIPEAELARALVAGERGDMVGAGVAVRRAAAALALAPGGGGRLPSLALETVRGRLAMAAATPAERQAALGGLTRASSGWATPAPRRLARLSLALRAVLLVNLDRAAEARALLDDVAGDGALIQIARAEAELALGDAEVARARAEAVAERSGLPLPLAVTALSAAARAAEATGDRPAALRLIGRALDLAEADGLRLALAAEGCAPLLARVLRTGTSHRALVGDVLELTATGTAQPVGAPVDPLREPLTERELAVLRFLPTMLSSQEIAGELYVTLNTVKSHLRNLYRKLGVNGRREAVDRGRALGLLAPGTLGARPS
ncbi:LuxR C-terminal-related transcriptional regulator [Baekduia sp. Peel2402]|uniref:LuxR C-terminal-related transcriptional regulator n=1 Tax=Baekduia sp. Peel2402 TaxID=3458296 RepID=UPI00403ED690